MSLGERPRGSARLTPNEHYNSLPRTSIEGALGIGPSDRGLFVVHVLPTACFVFDLVFILLAVGHGSALHVGPAQVGTAQVGIAQVGIAQVGRCETNYRLILIYEPRFV